MRVTIPPGPVEVETNLGGYDEAGYLSPDFEWVATVASEFPHLQVRTSYQIPTSRQEAIAPYEVRARWACSVRRAWVEVIGAWHWRVLEG